MSRAYLFDVLVVAGWVVWTLASWDSLDASLAGSYLLFATLPVSYLGVLAIDTPVGEVVFYAAIVLGALVNAMVLGLLAALVRRGLSRLLSDG